MAENIVHVLDDEGHRGAYLSLFSSVLDFSPIVKPLRINNLLFFLRADRILFSTINFGQTFKWFFIISLIRAFLMKPTCLILLGGVKYLDEDQPNHVKVQKICLRVWKHLYKQTTLSIIPYHLDERLSIYTKNYIYDPQMWDMYCSEYSKQFEADIDFAKQQIANNEKPVVVFLGKVTQRKGLNEFIAFVKANKNDAQFIIAGKIPNEHLVYTEQLEKLGVKVINEFLEESKFLGFYEIADFVWCYYKPMYDQTSGVFGRAIQLGVIPIVRYGSMISRIAKNHDIPCVELNFESETKNKKISDIPAKKDSTRNSYFAKIKDDALEKLRTYLYL